MKILDKIFRRKAKVQNELPIEAPEEILKPTTLYQAIINDGRVIDSPGVLTDYKNIEVETERYMGQDYVCVDFSVTPSSSDSWSYHFNKFDFSFKILYGLEVISDAHSLVDILGRNSKNLQHYRKDGNYAPLDIGSLYGGLEARTRILIPESSLDNLDDEYLKKLESASGVAETSMYPNRKFPNFRFKINMSYLSSQSRKIPKIARRDARVANGQILELKKKPIQNKHKLIETYERHPFMDIKKKERITEMLRRIPDRVDVAKILESFNFQPYDSEEVTIVQQVNSELKKIKDQLRTKKGEFEKQYGRLDNLSDETTIKLYNERLNAYLSEDDKNIRNISYKRMNILDSLSNPNETIKLREKVESNGIRSLNKDEWKKYFRTIRALKKFKEEDE